MDSEDSEGGQYNQLQDTTTIMGHFVRGTMSLEAFKKAQMNGVDIHRLSDSSKPVQIKEILSKKGW